MSATAQRARIAEAAHADATASVKAGTFPREFDPFGESFSERNRCDASARKAVEFFDHERRLASNPDYRASVEAKEAASRALLADSHARIDANIKAQRERQWAAEAARLGETA